MRRGFDESRTKHQILGRVTNQHQLGKDDQIGAESSRVIPGTANDREVTGDVSDDRIDLGDGYREAHSNRL